MNPAKVRTHKRFTQSLDKAPRLKHCRTEETHETIRRPINANPRRVQDWR